MNRRPARFLWGADMDYKELVDSVLIPAFKEYGLDVTLTPIDSSDGETVTPGEPVTAYAVDLGTYENWKPGTSVREGSKKLIIAGLSCRPRPGDKVTIDSTTMMIVDVEAIQPGGEVLYYEVYVK